MKNWGPLLAVLAVLGFLYFTNPDEAKVVEWSSERITANLPPPGADENGWETMGHAMALAAMPGIIRSYNSREDYLLFSLYRGRGPWTGALLLGVAGRIVPLENSHSS